MALTETFYQDRNMYFADVYSRSMQMVPNFPIQGRYWFVDANNGSAQHDGRSWATPKLTMADVFDELDSGDVVYFHGNVKEQLSSPAGVFDVTIIGAGNRPRDPDAHTGNNGYSAARWSLPASPTAATPCLMVRQQGWRLANFLMRADTSQECVQLFRDGSSGDDERDASHFECIGMRFDGAGVGVMLKGGPNFVTVRDSLFRGMTTAIANTTGAGIGTNAWTNIKGCRFHDNTNHIVVPLNQSDIVGCTLGKFTTKSIDLTNGIGNNVVWGNALSGTYSNAGGYTAAANDEWGGNYNSLSGGVTAADPA